MYINEAIERANKLLSNEYSLEEKYHWCDVVGGELMSSAIKRMKCAELMRWTDGTFLMPEDCDFTRIEKFIVDGREVDKCDMSTYGLMPLYGERGRAFMKAKCCPDKLEVFYREKYMPIRRISLVGTKIGFNVTDSANYYSGFSMNRECPFIAGDSVKALINGKQYIFNVIKRTADFNEVTSELKYLLDCELDFDLVTDIEVEGKSEIEADLERIVTDKTVCEAPYDEMYIDYICAQICFYQQDMDMYQQFIARYNERKEEYINRIKAYAPASDDVRFKNWW